MLYKTRAKKIISGGQTGIDRGALDACLKNGFPTGGWCPKERHAEDGKIDHAYPLKETDEPSYKHRTRKNILDSDGTLIISPGILFGGTFITQKIAEEQNKPCLVISVLNEEFELIPDKIAEWIHTGQIETLNIAGPRKSHWLTGYEISFLITEKLIEKANS